MKHLYHYCASWMQDGSIASQGGVMTSPDTICFANYPQFVAAVAREVGQEGITIVSLSFLGTEQ
jgi:hypothetical protein